LYQKIVLPDEVALRLRPLPAQTEVAEDGVTDVGVAAAA
jgi:hypothetical protein